MALTNSWVFFEVEFIYIRSNLINISIALFDCLLSQDIAALRALGFTYWLHFRTVRVLENSAAQGLCLISCCKHIPVSGL